ncbi:KAP family P-loop NTPase fold protein [Pyxidicoccus trucidator]|uniref:KAP family P-loop NTPase fold protein n=1 Tax=Pyxidicoccus trucidator TaxID=2709662 RepID=UPI0013DB95BC|nr:P-loop NTPase fold protein [Pyxidicoccus trucidator]
MSVNNSQEPTGLTTLSLKEKISSDRPGQTLEEDRYELRDSFIPRLARIAVEWPTQDGLVVGLFGPWGIGKTTVLNMLRDHVRRHMQGRPNVRFVAFNPWFYEDAGALVMAFFATIAAEIAVDQEKPWARAASALRAMGTFLTVASKGVTVFGVNVDAGKLKEASDIAAQALNQTAELSGGLAGLADLAGSGHKKLDEHRMAVEAGLKELGKAGGRLIIELDDVDRLNKTELLGLLRLVRIVADLPFVSLIVAMDDRRVRDVLEGSVLEGYGKGYLDKIVQVPMHIPLPNDRVMMENISEQIAAVLAAVRQSLPSELVPLEFWMRDSPLSLLTSAIRTPRDLKRYVNGLRALFVAGDDPDVDVVDAVLLEALRFFQPDVYDRIRRNKAFLTELLSSNELSMSRVDKNNEEERHASRDAKLDAIVRGSASVLSPDVEEFVRGVLKHLFGSIVRPDSLRNPNDEAARRRIRSPRIFDNYFRHAPPTGAMTRGQVKLLCDRLVALARSRDVGGIASLMIVELQGRALPDAKLIAEEVGYWIPDIGPPEFECVVSGVASTAGQLDKDLVVHFLVKLIGVAARPSYGNERGWSPELLQEQVNRLVGAAVGSRLTIVDVHGLIRRAQRGEVSEKVITRAAFKWIESVAKQVEEGDPFEGQDVQDAAEALVVAGQMIAERGSESPVSREHYKASLVRYAERMPERLPHLLLMVGYSAGDAFGLLNKRQSESDLIRIIGDVFGEYERLKSVYMVFRSRGIDAGRLGRIIEQFGALVSNDAS